MLRRIITPTLRLYRAAGLRLLPPTKALRGVQVQDAEEYCAVLVEKAADTYPKGLCLVMPGSQRLVTAQRLTYPQLSAQITEMFHGVGFQSVPYLRKPDVRYTLGGYIVLGGSINTMIDPWESAYVLEDPSTGVVTGHAANVVEITPQTWGPGTERTTASPNSSQQSPVATYSVDLVDLFMAAVKNKKRLLRDGVSVAHPQV
jgi:hypothetical protein